MKQELFISGNANGAGLLSAGNRLYIVPICERASVFNLITMSTVYSLVHSEMCTLKISYITLRASRLGSLKHLCCTHAHTADITKLIYSAMSSDSLIFTLKSSRKWHNAHSIDKANTLERSKMRVHLIACN